MKTITIFLASSEELEEERRQFESFIYQRCKAWDTLIKVVAWENSLSNSMAKTRLQDKYNDEIRACDIFVGLFFTKVGPWTEEEFDIAWDSFNKKDKPLVFTYFKETDDKQESLQKFWDKVWNLGHFPTNYKTTEDLHLQFWAELERYLDKHGITSEPVANNPLMNQKNILIVILALLALAVVIFFSKGGNNIDIKNPQGPVIINQGNEYHSYGISPERFGQLSEDLGVTKVALRNFFKIIEKEQVALYDLDDKLREIAKNYKELMLKVATLNPDDSEVAELIEQARKAIENGEFDQAEQLFNQASDLDIKAAERMQKLANKRFVSAAESLAANGNLKMTQLAYREAGEYYEKAAKLLPMGNDEDLALYLNNAGYAFYDAGLYDKTKPLYERALAISEKIFDKEHPAVATSLNNLAGIYRTQGNYDKAKPLYERSLAIREKVYGKKDIDVAQSLNNLAGLHRIQGNYDQAKSLFERSLAIWEKTHGKEHPDVATGLNNLADSHRIQGDYEQAKPLYERSLAIREKIFGKEHPDVATSLNSLANLYYTQGNYKQAKPLYERSLAIHDKIFGKEHPDVATSINNLANLYYTQGNYKQAKPLFERSLAIYEKVYGKEHPDVANGLNNLSALYYSQGNYEQAKLLLEWALKILNKFFDANHPNVILYTKNYNDLLAEMNNQ